MNFFLFFFLQKKSLARKMCLERSRVCTQNRVANYLRWSFGKQEICWIFLAAHISINKNTSSSSQVDLRSDSLILV